MRRTSSTSITAVAYFACAIAMACDEHMASHDIGYSTGCRSAVNIFKCRMKGTAIGRTAKSIGHAATPTLAIEIEHVTGYHCVYALYCRIIAMYS